MRRKSEQSGANEVRPRYFVWENVVGAFSTDHGEDFRTVLEEVCKIADENAVIPRLAGGG
jgi:DNA (cytosine-5)-methyltransferase 1